MSVSLSPLFNTQTVTENGAPAVGWTVTTYQAGSSTPLPTFTDSSGATPQSNPMVLDSLGLPALGQVWLTSGVAYKFVLADASGVVKRTEDNVTGVPSATATLDQWVISGAAPLYISANSFSFQGDQTSTFTPGRRVKLTTSAGTLYATILTSVFAASITTITLSVDGGTALDSGLSTVAYAMLSSVSDSLPRIAAFTPPSAVRGLRGQPNATTPTTKYDLTVTDYVTLRNNSGESITFSNVGTITLDISLPGPARGGRDRAAALAVSSWAYMYFVSDGATISAVISPTAPASFTGSTLPTGDKMWAFAGIVRINGGGQIAAMYYRGSTASHAVQQSALSGGSAVVETPVTVSPFVPPEALSYCLHTEYANNGAGAGAYSAGVRLVSGSALYRSTIGVTSAAAIAYQNQNINLPNVGQSFNYFAGSALTQFSAWVTSFTVANGGE